MIRFTNSLTEHAEGQRGYIDADISATSGTDMALVQYSNPTSGNGTAALFLAFNTETATAKYNSHVHSTTGPTDIDYVDRDFFTPVAKTSTACTRSDNGGTLLGWANTWKDIFFGGQTQTVATLYQWLCEKYGPHDAFYPAQGTYTGLYDPDRWVGNIIDADHGFDHGTARDIPFVENVNKYTGGDYGAIVSEYPDQTAQTYKDSFIMATLIFDENIAPPSSNELIFHVYIDGTKDPNVSVRWEANISDTFSLQLVNPIVWTIPRNNSTPPPYVVSDSGILVPDEHNAGFVGRTMRKYANTWPGQYDAPYLSEFNTDASGASTFEKITEYGFDQIADQMCYYMRFNQQTAGEGEMVATWGTLYEVRVPRDVNSAEDIFVDNISDSENNPEFTTSIVIHIGAAPEDIPDDDDEYPDGQDSTGNDPGVYDPDVPPHDFTTGESSGFSGKAILTRTYAMTALVTQNVGSKLWSQSYFDVLKIQNNPIENIVSVKWFPFSVTGPAGSVKVGDVDFQINADIVDSIYKFTIGSVRYDATDKSNPSFLDMSPFTTLKLHLPYCGIVQLDATEMLNRKITVKYAVDLVSGDCMAFIYLDDNIPYMNVAGHCGVDIPLTSTNRIQSEMRAASTTISAVTGAAAHMVSGDLAGAAMDAAQGALSIGGMDYTSQRTSSHSPACTSTGNRACYLEIFKPAYKESAGFKSRHGYPCHLYKKLGSFTGFVKCDARTKIDFAMTRRENEMLEQLLTSGVYV